MNDHWFEGLADHMGEAYLNYSFTKGTKQEVEFLVSELNLKTGMKLLDVGCGPGRHSHYLAELGIEMDRHFREQIDKIDDKKKAYNINRYLRQ